MCTFSTYFSLAKEDLKKHLDSTVLETTYVGFLKWMCQTRNGQDVPLAAGYQWLQKTVVTGVIPSTDIEKEGRQTKMVLILCSSLGLWGTGTTYHLCPFIAWLWKIRTRAANSDWGLKGSLILLYNRSNFNTIISDREAQRFCNSFQLAKIKDATVSGRNMVWPPWREAPSWKQEQETRAFFP